MGKERADRQSAGSGRRWAGAVELAGVLLLSAGCFLYSRYAALAGREGAGYGGEYLFFLLPALYYIGKIIAADWLSALRPAADRDDAQP